MVAVEIGYRYRDGRPGIFVRTGLEKLVPVSDTETHHQNVINLFNIAHPFDEGFVQDILLFRHGFLIDPDQQFLEVLGHEFLLPVAPELIDVTIGEHVEGIALFDINVMIIE